MFVAAFASKRFNYLYMKSVRIVDIIPPDKFNEVRTLRKYYKICMPGADYDFYFINEKAANKFAVDLSKHLTSTLHELNFITTDVYAIYRRLWFYNDVEKISILFKDLDKQMNYLVDHIQIHFQYTALRNIIEYLQNILSQLIRTAIYSKHYNERHQIKAVKELLRIIKDKLYSFGINSKYRINNDSKKLS